ncbi:MAG: VOC family protein [Bryobacteraceae bacterium]
MAKVRPIPKGYHTVTPALAVKGGAGFIKFCKKVFGATEVTKMTGPGGIILHAELKIGDSYVMVGDEMPGMGNASAATLGGTPATLHVYVPDCDAVYNKALKAGATVRMPLADQFWGDRYGAVVDPFGNAWAIATHIEDVDLPEMKRRAKKMMKEMAAAGAGGS